MPSPDDACDALLVRSASGSAARRILRTLLGDRSPRAVKSASLDETLVLWVGDVVIRDAVPLAALALRVADGTMWPLALARADECGDDAIGHLARAVLAACAKARARSVVLPSADDDASLVAFFDRVADGRPTSAVGDRRMIDLPAP